MVDTGQVSAITQSTGSDYVFKALENQFSTKQTEPKQSTIENVFMKLYSLRLVLKQQCHVSLGFDCKLPHRECTLFSDELNRLDGQLMLR